MHTKEIVGDQQEDHMGKQGAVRFGCGDIKGLFYKTHALASELIDRLKHYDDVSKTYHLDLLSIPKALRMVLRVFPHKYCTDRLLNDGILRAFVTTIIPGADVHEEHLVRMYSDEYYPFHIFCGYFVYDLDSRARRLFDGREFTTLDLNQRTSVVADALSGSEVTRRLYKGAILMAQVSYFGAVYNEDRGCSLIGFPGRNEGYSRDECTYPFATGLFDKELSLDGHPW